MKRFQIRWPDEWLRRTRLFRTDLLSYSGKDFIVSVSLYLISVGFCLVLRNFDPNNDTSYVSMIFLLDVFLTALLTDGLLFQPDHRGVRRAQRGLHLHPALLGGQLHAGGLSADVPGDDDHLRGDRYRYQPGQEGQRDASGRRSGRRSHGNLLRAVSHDIRTPLTGIVGATNVLLEQDDTLTPQQRRELLKNANEEAQWLIHIVENLLSITRIGAGEDAQVTKTPEAAEEVIEGAVGKFRRQYPQIDVRVELAGGVSPGAHGPAADPAGDDEPSWKTPPSTASPPPGSVVIPGNNGGNGPGSPCADNGRGIARRHGCTTCSTAPSSAQKGDSTRSMGIGLSVCRTVVRGPRRSTSKEKISRGAAPGSRWTCPW